MAARKLSGSTRAPLPGAVSRGKADPTERLEVTIILRRASALPPITRESAKTIMPRATFASSFGASVGDVASVKAFAGQHNLTTVQESPARRTVILSGTVADFQAAFGVELQSFDYPGGSYRGRVGDIFLPEELDGVVEAVLGLDNRPQATPHFRMRSRASRSRCFIYTGSACIAVRFSGFAGAGSVHCHHRARRRLSPRRSATLFFRRSTSAFHPSRRSLSITPPIVRLGIPTDRMARSCSTLRSPAQLHPKQLLRFTLRQTPTPGSSTP